MNEFIKAIRFLDSFQIDFDGMLKDFETKNGTKGEISKFLSNQLIIWKKKFRKECEEYFEYHKHFKKKLLEYLESKQEGDVQSIVVVQILKPIHDLFIERKTRFDKCFVNLVFSEKLQEQHFNNIKEVNTILNHKNGPQTQLNIVKNGIHKSLIFLSDIKRTFFVIEKLFLETADSFFSNGQFDKAIMIYELFIKFSPTPGKCYYELGGIHCVKGNLKKGLEFYTKSIFHLGHQKNSYFRLLLIKVIFERAITLIRMEKEEAACSDLHNCEILLEPFQNSNVREEESIEAVQLLVLISSIKREITQIQKEKLFKTKLDWGFDSF